MKRRELLSAGLIGGLATSLYAQRAQPVVPVRQYPRILAHFCTWHRKRPGLNTWDQASSIPWRSDGNGIGYDSLDPAILRQQCAEMARYGIIPLASWWGALHLAGDEWLNLWVSEKRPIPAAILYEGADASRTRRDGDGRWYMDAPDNATVLRSELTHLYEKYLSRYPDHFLKVEGRPYILLWPLHAWEGDLAAVFSSLAIRDKLFLAGTAMEGLQLPSSERLSVLAGLDAVTAYNMYRQDIAHQYGGTFTPELVARYRSTMLVWQEWLATHLPKAKMLLPLTLSYDDHKVPQRENPTFTTSPSVGRAVLAEMLQMVSHFTLYCGNVLWYVTLSSYNEHFEATAWEANSLRGDQDILLGHECLTSKALPQPLCTLS